MVNQENLWPDFEPTTIPTSPQKLMQQQAAFLKANTDSRIYANVHSTFNPQKASEIILSFQIIVPLLQNYKYTLFRVKHPIEGYPLQIFGFEDMKMMDVNNPEEFTKGMREIFNSEDTIKKISTLLSYE